MDANGMVGHDPVERLVAQHEIERQIYQMGYYLEDGNFEAVSELLADATFGADILGRGAFRGREEIRRQYERTNVTYADRGRATKEIYSNILVELDLEGDRATSVTSYTVAQQPPGDSFGLIVAGRYEDEWRRVDGMWRWSDRYIKVQYRNNLDRHMHADQHPWSGDGRESATSAEFPAASTD
jgi:SnoaL-like domain